MEGYKQTEIGVIPEDWGVFTIGETVTLINGRAFKPSDWTTYGLPIIRIQNLNDPEATYNYYEKAVEDRYYVNYGDILFAWSGTKESSFGARMWHGQKAILNQHIFRVVPDKEKLLSQYVLLALKRFQEDIERKSHGFKSSFVHVRKSDLENTYLAIPPLPEQQAIATALSDVDGLITILDKLIAKKRHIKTATMQQLLTGKKRLPGFGDGKGYRQTEVGVIPEDWEVKTLGDIGQSFIGLTYRPDDTCDYGTLVLRSSNIQNDQLAFDDNVYVSTSLALPSRVITEEGDILICVRNGSRKLIGKCALIGPETAGSAFGAFMSIFRTTLPDFTFFQFQSAVIQRQINEIMGATINQITTKDLVAFQIPLPPSEIEQQAIATVLSDMETEITALEARRTKTQAIKQGMMQELLTGRTRLI